jgi:hypothetical protein
MYALSGPCRTGLASLPTATSAPEDPFMSRSPRLAAAITLVGLLVAGRAHALQFTDWQAVDLVNDVVQGVAGPVSVTMSGGNIDFFVPNSTGFNDPVFCPPLAIADLIEFHGLPTAPSYTIEFDRPVHNPVLLVRSLASTLTFPGQSITRLCGQSTFTVSGNQVMGSCEGGGPPPVDTDANGTIRVNGWVSTVTFTATFAGNCGSVDGIHIQIGADPLNAPASAPAGLWALAAATLLLGAIALVRARMPRSA